MPLHTKLLNVKDPEIHARSIVHTHFIYNYILNHSLHTYPTNS